MHKDAAHSDLRQRLDELRLLAETGFLDEAREEAERLLAEAPDDPERLGLAACLHHRAGAVSPALDHWRRLNASSPHGHSAILRLAQLREEVHSPRERGTDLPLVRRALQFFANGQHDRALAACAEGAAVAHRHGDFEQRKLLGLLEALLLEIAGRHSDAASSLTLLGADPRFAHDLDRLAILARVCERAGDRAGLLAAERVLGFLAATGKLSAHPRLAELRRSLGDDTGVRATEADFEEAFRRRIHVLTPQERLAAAARRYVPPERLGPLPPEAPTPAERGVFLLAQGDAAQALEFLPPGPWRLAALARLDRADQADPFHPTTLPDALLVANHVAGPNEPALGILRRAVSRGAADPELLRALAALERRHGAEHKAAALEARAEAAERNPWPPAGVVRAAAIYVLPGKLKGLVHELVARRLPAGARDRGRLLDNEIHGNLAKGVRSNLRRIFAAVRESLIARWPERQDEMNAWAYGLHVTKEDEPSGGSSLDLPAAIAFASALLQQRVPRHLVFTGALSYDAAGISSVRPVGEVGIKLRAALHAGARTLVFPASQQDEALAGVHVPKSWAARSIAPVSTLDEALSLIAP